MILEVPEPWVEKVGVQQLLRRRNLLRTLPSGSYFRPLGAPLPVRAISSTSLHLFRAVSARLLFIAVLISFHFSTTLAFRPTMGTNRRRDKTVPGGVDSPP